VTELWRYPVKSLAGERRGAVTLDVPLVELAAEAVVLDHARSRDAVWGAVPTGRAWPAGERNQSRCERDPGSPCRTPLGGLWPARSGSVARRRQPAFGV